MYNSIYPFHTGFQIVLGSPRVWDYSGFKGDMVTVFNYMNICHLSEDFSLLELGSMVEICRKAYMNTQHTVQCFNN